MANKNSDRPLVVILGAGPGDPNLITVEAVEWLRRADAILYDRLAPRALLGLAREDAEKICVGKVAGQGPDQAQINALLIDKCLPGSVVVRLKGGDPFVFGRGAEEAEALNEAGIPFRIVPGITAAAAAAAFAGIPLTDRRVASAVAFVTGHEAAGKGSSSIDWVSLARLPTVVFYMGVARLPEIARRLIASGRPADTPAAVVADASLPRQRTVVATLATIAEAAQAAAIKPPAVVIIGDVVSMRRQLEWFEKLPLSGQTVLVTRSRGQASGLSQMLRRLGANVVESPTIRTAPPDNFGPIDAALRRLDRFDWVLFASPNGVQAVFDRLHDLGLDARAFGAAKIAAVGPATAAALNQRTIGPDLMPGQFTTEALAEALEHAEQLEDKELLLLRSDIAPALLADRLRAAGAVVTELTAYKTMQADSLPADAVEMLRNGSVDWITFTSSSTVKNFAALLGDEIDISSVKLAAIGPVTAKALHRCGLKPTVTAKPHTIDALAAAIAAFDR